MANPYENSRGIRIRKMGDTAWKHTYRDLGLIPAPMPLLGEAAPDFKRIAVPGASGSLDLSRVLTGSVTYSDREGSWPYYVAGPRNTWNTVRSQIVNAYHGQEVQIIQDWEPDVYLQGDLQVEDKSDRQDGSLIVLSGIFDPFKMDLTDSSEPWLWDPFDFEQGVIREYGSIETTAAGTTITFISSPAGGLVEMKASVDGISVTWSEGSSAMLRGLNTTWTEYPEFVVPMGYEEVRVTFWGAGTVSIRYRGGRL